MLKVECFAAYRESDTVEGRGPRILIANFKNEADARTAAKGGGAMGTDGTVEPVTVTVYENIEEFVCDSEGHIIERAVAKLTPEEARVLAKHFRSGQ